MGVIDIYWIVWEVVKKPRIFYCQADRKGGKGQAPRVLPLQPLFYEPEKIILTNRKLCPSKITVLTIFETLRRLELIMLESR